MQLRRPELSDKVAITDMMKGFEASRSVHDSSFWSVDNFVYEDWIERNQSSEMGTDVLSTFVLAVQFVSFDDNGGALGFLYLRLRLNDNLLSKGGRIGYSIRPSEYHKGLVKEQLHLGLLEAKKKNIKQILVICHAGNIVSQKVILANGGVLENARELTERYWTNLDEK